MSSHLESESLLTSGPCALKLQCQGGFVFTVVARPIPTNLIRVVCNVDCLEISIQEFTPSTILHHKSPSLSGVSGNVAIVVNRSRTSKSAQRASIVDMSFARIVPHSLDRILVCLSYL